MVRRVLALIVIFILAAFARPALAQTYSMTDNLEPNAWMGPVTINWSETVGSTTTHYSESDIAAGPQVVTFVGTPPPFYKSSYDVYCVDMYHEDQPVTLVDLEPFDAVSNLKDYDAAFDGLTQAQWNIRLDQSAWLYSEYNPMVQGANGLTKAEDGAALQLAIWNVMLGSNSGFSFTNGGVSSSEFSSVQSLEASWYDSLGYHVGDGTLFQTDRQVDPVNGQDLLGPPPMAPESSSLWLLAFALAPLALIAIQKRRMAAKGKS